MGGRRLGLVIGNQGYDDPLLRTLVAPSLDVRLVAEVLQDEAVGQFDEVEVLLDAPEGELRRAIARFCANRTADDTLVLFFSGHGILDEEGLLHLAARDTEPRLLNATAVPAEYIRAQLNRCSSRRQVLILDCCHSGAITRGTKGAPGASVGAGTALITPGYGRVVLTASDATQYAWDGEAVQGQPEASVFTRYLVEGLRTGAADLDGDGLINIDELYEYVYGKVLSVSSKQTPAKFADRQQGAIFIARSARPTINRALLSADLLETLTDRRPWLREGAVLELGRIFLDAHQGRAATAAAQLQELADKDDSARVRAAARHMLGKRVATAIGARGWRRAPSRRAARGGGPGGRRGLARWRPAGHCVATVGGLCLPPLPLARARAPAGPASPCRSASRWPSWRAPGRWRSFRAVPPPPPTASSVSCRSSARWARRSSPCSAAPRWARSRSPLSWPGAIPRCATARCRPRWACGPASGCWPSRWAPTRRATHCSRARWPPRAAASSPAGPSGASRARATPCTAPAWSAPPPSRAGGRGSCYLLAVSRYFGSSLGERWEAAHWFVVHLVFFEGMSTGSWALSGALFGLVAALAAMVLLVRVRVALPPPHAFANPRARATLPTER